MALTNAFGNLALDASVVGISTKIPAQLNNKIPVIPANVNDSVSSDSFSNLSGFTTSLVSNDIFQVDGNSISPSYLVFSLDPLSANVESTVSYATTFKVPFHAALGLSLSQRVLGQDFSVEYISTESALTPMPSVAVSSIVQTGTAVTVTTSTNHNFVTGQSISITGIASDSRLNYPALVVASIGATNQFTATSGPGGTIASLIVGPYVGVGSVFARSRMGYARNGTSIIFENATANNASIYTRSAGGQTVPGSTVAGYITNHSSTVGTTASVQAINARGVFSFQPTNQYDYILDPFSVTVSDRTIDSSTASNTVRLKRDQIVPDELQTYYLRIRGTKQAGATIPNAKIVSASKSGTTTATINTDVAHGLSINDFVNIYGIRDTTNFPNLTTATQIASVPTTTSFTIVIGPSATATSNGGYVSRVNGGTTQPGAITQVLQSISRTSNQIIAVGSAAWSGISIGDYVNLHGVYDTSGVYLNLDGPYKVFNISTTTLTLEPIGNAPTGVDIVSTNCGGANIKRTDLRLHYFRAHEYQRLSVESYGGGFSRNDVGSSIPTAVINTPAVTLSGTGAVNVSQIVANTPITLTPNGSTNRAIVSGIAGPTNNVDYSAQAWSAASGSGAVIANAQGLGNAASFHVNVTAYTAGSSQGLDIYLQESPDNGSAWFDIWQCETVTSVTSFRIPSIPIGGRRRFRWVNRGGAATTATVTINAMDLSVAAVKQVQWFDRTSGIGTGTATLNTNSGSYDIAGCKIISVVAIASTSNSPASFKAQMSVDGTNWYDASSSVGIGTTVAANVPIPITTNTVGRFIRLNCTNAGTTQIMNGVHIYGTN